MTQINVDGVKSYALIKKETSILIDGVKSYALISQPVRTLLTYKKTFRSYFFDSIRLYDNIHLNPDYITLSNPVTLTDNPRGYDTTLTFAVSEQSGFRGDLQYYYRRNSIEDLILNRDVLDKFRPPLDLINTTRDVLVHFNTHFKTFIDPSEIVDEPLVSGGEVVFIASDDSLFFTPGTSASVGVLVDGDRYEALPVDTLVWDVDILNGIWTQGLDLTMSYKGVHNNSTFINVASNVYINTFYDDPTMAPISTNTKLYNVSKRIRGTTDSLISNRSRKDCVYAMELIPSGTSTRTLFHYDIRQR